MFGLLKRRSFFAGTLAAAVGVPYVMNDPDWRTTADRLLSSVTSSAPEATTDSAATNRGSGTASDLERLVSTNSLPLQHGALPPHLAAFPDGRHLPTALEGPRVQDFGEVLRFDITPQWILSRWARVTTVLSEYELEGLRVPFVSGTRLDDVSGSLTYYYDKQRRLQRIALEGHTGDERRLAAHVQRYFGLTPEPSLYAGLLMAKWNGVPKSALVFRHAAIVSSASPHLRLEVQMEINRPDNYYQVSLPFQRQLQEGQHSSRWGG